MAGYCSAPPSTLLAPITMAGGMLVTQYYSSDPPFVRNNNIWLSLQIPCYRPLNTKWPLYMAKITILQRGYNTSLVSQIFVSEIHIGDAHSCQY